MEFKYESNRIYAEDADNKVIAEVTFPEKDGVATVDHTFVDDSLRGQGVGGELVKGSSRADLSVRQEDCGDLSICCFLVCKASRV